MPPMAGVAQRPGPSATVPLTPQTAPAASGNVVINRTPQGPMGDFGRDPWAYLKGGITGTSSTAAPMSEMERLQRERMMIMRNMQGG